VKIHEIIIRCCTIWYDLEAIEDLIEHVNAVKIGSDDITYTKLLSDISLFNKPILLATGASNIKDVMVAVEVVLTTNTNICLMQCNTNYTGNLENFKYVNLNVLKIFSTL